jgi:hypothetical protein
VEADTEAFRAQQLEKVAERKGVHEVGGITPPREADARPALS